MRGGGYDADTLLHTQENLCGWQLYLFHNNQSLSFLVLIPGIDNSAFSFNDKNDKLEIVYFKVTLKGLIFTHAQS